MSVSAGAYAAGSSHRWPHRGLVERMASSPVQPGVDVHPLPDPAADIEAIARQAFAGGGSTAAEWRAIGWPNPHLELLDLLTAWAAKRRFTGARDTWLAEIGAHRRDGDPDADPPPQWSDVQHWTLDVAVRETDLRPLLQHLDACVDEARWTDLLAADGSDTHTACRAARAAVARTLGRLRATAADRSLPVADRRAALDTIRRYSDDSGGAPTPEYRALIDSTLTAT